MDISPQITIYNREISLGCSLSQFLKNFICFAGWYYLIFILSSYDSFFFFLYQDYRDFPIWRR